LLEVVASLREIGVPARNLLVFERYANEFREAGYERVLTERVMDGVRWFASSSGYDDTQLAIDGLAPAASATRTSSAMTATCSSRWVSATPPTTAATTGGSARTYRSSSRGWSTRSSRCRA